MVSRQASIVIHKIVFRIRQLIQQLLDICPVNVQVFQCSVSHHAKNSRMMGLTPCAVSFSRNKVHKDSTFFGLIEELLGDLLQPNHANCARKPSTACAMSDLEFWTQRAFPMLRPRFRTGQRLLLSAVAFPQLPETTSLNISA